MADLLQFVNEERVECRRRRRSLNICDACWQRRGVCRVSRQMAAAFPLTLCNCWRALYDLEQLEMAARGSSTRFIEGALVCGLYRMRRSAAFFLPPVSFASGDCQRQTNLTSERFTQCTYIIHAVHLIAKRLDFVISSRTAVKITQ